MVIDENYLCQIVLKVLEKLQDEKYSKQTQDKKNLLVVLTGDINKNCFEFYNKITKKNSYNIFTVIPNLIENDVLKKLIDSGFCGKVLRQNEMNFDEIPDSITVFPIVPRDLVAKAALCISDTFETKLIKFCISNGKKIIMLKSGLEKFTGKEPKAYINKISEYYRMISEYGIALKDDIVEDYNYEAEHHNFSGHSCNAKKKKIITESELDKFCINNKIILNSDDIITELAREKALELGIEITREH